VLDLREALPLCTVGAVTIFTVAVTTARPSSFVRRFFATCTIGSDVTDKAGVSSSSSSDSEELEEELDELRETGLATDRFLVDFSSSELELSEESLSESESELELESELEEGCAALGCNPVFFFGGPLATSGAESELELELESELKDFALRVGLFAFGGLSSSSESESESELELESEDDVGDIFGFIGFCLLLPSTAPGPESELLSASASASSSSLESELDSSEDSSSLLPSSAEDSVLLESRWDSFLSATGCTAF
jgi:hypothetical protein